MTLSQPETRLSPITWAIELVKFRNQYDLVSHLNNFRLKPFPVNGDDLIEIGYKPNIKLGITIKNLKDYWADNGYNVSKEDILKLAKEKINE